MLKHLNTYICQIHSAYNLGMHWIIVGRRRWQINIVPCLVVLNMLCIVYDGCFFQPLSVFISHDYPLLLITNLSQQDLQLSLLSYLNLSTWLIRLILSKPVLSPNKQTNQPMFIFALQFTMIDKHSPWFTTIVEYIIIGRESQPSQQQLPFTAIAAHDYRQSGNE